MSPTRTADPVERSWAGRLQRRLPDFVLPWLLRVPRLSDRHRYELASGTALRLLASGRDPAADRLVRVALKRIRSPRLRADLLGDVVSWSLAQGRQPGLALEAYAAELAVADRHLTKRRYRAAAESFEEAMSVAFHRVLHFDHVTSPLASDPVDFTAPLAGSGTARAVRASRGRSHGPGDVQTDPTRPTRLLLATRKNDDFLGEIRTHFTGRADFDTRFVDFLGVPELERYVRDPAALVEHTLAGKPALSRAAEAAFRPHLDWADVVFVEWGTALAALITQIDPGDTRIVVRVHSYEVFTAWPQLMDFTRIDDVVFVSEHLRDLALATIPGLREPGGPRCDVINLAMELRRFDRPKPDSARFTVAVVGASKVVKDPRWAIEVLRQLRAHDSRYRLLLIRGKLQDRGPGTHAYAEGLRRDLAEFEPSGAVQVLRHTDDVPAALQDVGVVLSSSVRESFHMGLVEGAASGAVPVVRDWPYFPGSARALFPADWVVDTPEAAAQRILETTGSDEVWRRTGQEASDYVIDRWDWDKVKLDFERLLRR